MSCKINVFVSIVTVIAVCVACTSGYMIVDGKYQNLTIDQKADTIIDKTYIEMLKPYSSALDSELTGVISFADTSLVADRPESPLSNFISDMLLKFGQQYAKEKLNNVQVDFSLANNGGLRTSIPAGEIMVRNIYELLPFENELVLLNLSGVQIAALADHIVSRGGEGVGGITFGMKGQKAVNILIQGKPLNLNATYWMITNDYVANGGDGMKILKEASGRIETGEKIRDVVLDGLKQMKANKQHVSAKTDGRIYHVE